MKILGNPHTTIPNTPLPPSKRLVAVSAGHVALTLESEHQSSTTRCQQDDNLGPTAASPTITPGFVMYSTALVSLGPPRSLPPPPPTSEDLMDLILELLGPPSITMNSNSNECNNNVTAAAAGEYQTARISDGDSPPILVIKHGGCIIFVISGPNDL